MFPCFLSHDSTTSAVDYAYACTKPLKVHSHCISANIAAEIHQYISASMSE